MALKRLFRRSRSPAAPEPAQGFVGIGKEEIKQSDNIPVSYVGVSSAPDVEAEVDEMPVDDPNIGNDDTVDIFKGENGRFYWHRLAPNGVLVSGSNEPDGFESYTYAKHSAVEYSGVPAERIKYRMDEKK